MDPYHYGNGQDDCSQCIHSVRINERCERCENGETTVNEGWSYLHYKFDANDKGNYLEFRLNDTSWYVMNDLQARHCLKDNTGISIPPAIIAEGIDWMVENGYW